MKHRENVSEDLNAKIAFILNAIKPYNPKLKLSFCPDELYYKIIPLILPDPPWIRVCHQAIISS
jgi:hypothetical protein